MNSKSFSLTKSLRKASSKWRCFLLKETRFIMSEPKTIYCPKCGRKVATWDGRSTINISVKCKKCNKLVVYDIENEKVKIKEIPQRTTSSGMRFY